MSLLKLIDLDALSRFKSKILALIPSTYAASPSAGGSATYANAIHYAQVDSTSTATKFTAQIPGITEYYDGLTVMLKNGVVTSTTNFTININGLGAKGAYTNLAAATRDTTIFNVSYTMLFVYDSTRVSGGCWICYRGYDANTNTVGYQVRTNSSTLPMTSIVYRYRLLFTSADRAHFVPANTSTSTNATAARAVCQDPIDPFGRILYYGTTASVAAGSRPSTSYLWQQYAINIGYSFQASPNYTLSEWHPIYLKCAPQSDGSAIIDSTTPFVQTLPSTEDGKIYIFLGVAYSDTSMELTLEHPVYYYKGGMIRPFTNGSYFDGDYNSLTNKPTIPSKTSDLTNDSGFITGYTETDPTVHEWAKAANKPSYTAAEVGLGNVDNVRQYSASNPPPYPVTSVNGATGAVTVAALPSVTASDNGKILKVVGGAWTAAILNVYNGGVS